MANRLFSDTPAEEMDEAYVTRLRRWRTLLWAVAAVAFASILVIEMQAMFNTSFLLLFGLAFAVLAVLFCSDLISSKIDAYESEQIWQKQGKGEK